MHRGYPEWRRCFSYGLYLSVGKRRKDESFMENIDKDQRGFVYIKQACNRNTRDFCKNYY